MCLRADETVNWALFKKILGCQLSRISHRTITVMPRQPMCRWDLFCLCPLTHVLLSSRDLCPMQKERWAGTCSGASHQPSQAVLPLVSRKLSIFPASLSTGQGS